MIMEKEEKGSGTSWDGDGIVMMRRAQVGDRSRK